MGRDYRGSVPASAAPSPAPRSVVVVGAGLAGLRSVAELRAQGFDGEVTVVGAEPVPPYDRPPLSKELFSRVEPVWLSGEGYGDLADLADRVLRGRRATAVRAGDDGVVLTVAPVDAADAGALTLRADVAVLATGAQPVRPAGWAGAAELHTVADAAALRGRLTPGTRLVVVGAGWIGAELAGQAAARGCAVTVVEAASTPLYRQLGADLGARTAPWYAAAGVELRCGAPVTAVEPGAVTLAGPDGAPGERLAADVVVTAVGVRPATGWLAGALPLTGRGALRVDPAGRVAGAPASLRAVGDCADMEVPGLGLVPGGHWDAALTHPAGVVAGLLGHDVPAPGAPYVFSTQLGHDLAFVGAPTEAATVLLRGDPDGAWSALLVEQGPAGTGRLTAGFTVDRPRDVVPLRKLLAAGARPLLDLARAADAAVPLRKAVLAADLAGPASAPA
ncbi:pyridine nucleotide-disulfide oxidoreductase [Georgenia ruanii]|uniref:Pyridine nucleotide-disulfide oxidoreductase n=1 Tax=Georgenia ruanii TaxID=348442 RepID=A0A7J9USA4_9MICO|nr:pyridine nucleotide-disulfide oxidoreductase [Georgenia ruanii]